MPSGPFEESCRVLMVFLWLTPFDDAQCSKWVPLEGVKNSEVKVPELFWWKHAKAYVLQFSDACRQLTLVDGTGATRLASPAKPTSTPKTTSTTSSRARPTTAPPTPKCRRKRRWPVRRRTPCRCSSIISSLGAPLPRPPRPPAPPTHPSACLCLCPFPCLWPRAAARTRPASRRLTSTGPSRSIPPSRHRALRRAGCTRGRAREARRWRAARLTSLRPPARSGGSRRAGRNGTRAAASKEPAATPRQPLEGLSTHSHFVFRSRRLVDHHFASVPAITIILHVDSLARDFPIIKHRFNSASHRQSTHLSDTLNHRHQSSPRIVAAHQRVSLYRS